jgi:hypothetical protein
MGENVLHHCHRGGRRVRLAYLYIVGDRSEAGLRPDERDLSPPVDRNIRLTQPV